MGELEPWMDETYLRQLFSSFGENVSVKMIRDKMTGGYANYCFLEFYSNAQASKNLNALNGTPIPNTNKVFRLNWASGGGHGAQGVGGMQSGGGSMDYSVFVGDLGGDVTESLLLQIFQAKYRSVKSARIVTDPVTGVSKSKGTWEF